jgi:FlaA1/EpsC-like NDP-sugar epimerase
MAAAAGCQPAEQRTALKWKKPELLLIGGGGHCKSCIDVIEQNGKYRVAGIVDVTENLHKKICGYENIATDADLPKLAREYENFFNQLRTDHKPSQTHKAISYP